MIIWNPWYGCHKLGHCVIKHDVNDIMAKVLAVVFSPIKNHCSNKYYYLCKNFANIAELLNGKLLKFR